MSRGSHIIYKEDGKWVMEVWEDKLVDKVVLASGDYKVQIFGAKSVFLWPDGAINVIGELDKIEFEEDEFSSCKGYAVLRFKDEFY